MRRTTTALASAAMLTAASPAPPPILDHVGPWNVHSSDNACMLGRVFGAGEQQVMVAFQPLFNGQTGEIFLSGGTGGGVRRGAATITQEPSGRRITGTYFSLVTDKKQKRTTRITVRREAWDGLTDTDILRIKAPPVDVRVKLVRFAAAKAVFGQCERQMLESWKVDPVALEAEGRPTPLNSPASYFRPDDYPEEAIRAGHVGRVVAVLSVDTSGAVTGCRIGSSSWPDLNEVTCRQAQRVRFAPARNRAGEPVASIFLLPVRWSMPGF